LDWGDESFSDWLGPYNSGQIANVSHHWNNTGSFNVRVKAKDSDDDESNWSEPLVVTMPKNKLYINRPILNFLQQYPNLFPLLRQLLLKL
jgi:hypothetical protein